MEIRFVSSLSPDEEERLAQALLAIVGRVLDPSSVTYAVRIRTTGRKVFDRAHPTLPSRDNRSRELPETSGYLF
jgi:hypothetical protein